MAGLLSAALGVLVVTPWLVQLFVADVALSLLLPVSFLSPTLAYNIASFIAGSVWQVVQFIFEVINGAQITRSGDELPAGESAIVISNHVSWSDFYMIQHLAINSDMLGRCRWFAKEQLKWVPFLGWGLWAMGMPLVSRNWEKDQKALERVFRGPRKFLWPIWLISYSEGTRYTSKKHNETVQWCRDHGKPCFEHVLFPRTKGFIAQVNQLGKGSSVRAVYDVTIAYAYRGRFMEAPTIWQSLSQRSLLKHWRFHVHVSRFDIESIAGLDDAKIAKWLEERWSVKSKYLQSLKQQLEDGKGWK